MPRLSRAQRSHARRVPRARCCLSRSRPRSSPVTGRTSQWRPRSHGSALLADRIHHPPVREQPRERRLDRLDAAAGGTDELAGQICEPDPIDLFFPDWYYVTSAGNVNAGRSRPASNSDRQRHPDPLFEDTCRTDPGDVDECTDPAPIGGVNQWYYFPQGAAIQLTGV